MRPTIALATLLTAMLVPAAGQALSCMAPNPAHEFNWQSETGKATTLLIGRLTPAGAVPVREGEEDIRADYTFRGILLGPDPDSDAHSVTTVRITDHCAGPWCASLPAGEMEGLFVARPDGTGFAISTGPCPGALHPEPDAQETAALRLCLATGRCTEKEITVFERRYE